MTKWVKWKRLNYPYLNIIFIHTFFCLTSCPWYELVLNISYVGGEIYSAYLHERHTSINRLCRFTPRVLLYFPFFWGGAGGDNICKTDAYSVLPPIIARFQFWERLFCFWLFIKYYIWHFLLLVAAQTKKRLISLMRVIRELDSFPQKGWYITYVRGTTKCPFFCLLPSYCGPIGPFVALGRIAQEQK